MKKKVIFCCLLLNRQLRWAMKLPAIRHYYLNNLKLFFEFIEKDSIYFWDSIPHYPLFPANVSRIHPSYLPASEKTIIFSFLGNTSWGRSLLREEKMIMIWIACVDGCASKVIPYLSGFSFGIWFGFKN